MPHPVRKSHTSTEQWQSFEVRMRRRRAERCRLRAEVALDAGFPEDAREGLNEARRLCPDLPHLAESEARLAAALALGPDPAERSRARLAVAVLSVAASLAVLVGFTAWLLIREGAPRTVSIATSDITAGSTFAPVSTNATPEAETSGLAAVAAKKTREITPEPAAASAADPERAEGRSARNPEPVPDISAPVPAVKRASDVADVATTDESPLASATGGALSSRPTSTDPAAAGIEPAPPLGTPSLPEKAASLPTTDELPAPDVAEARIRSVLSRYEAAYSELDAAAARAVWPTVNADALDRAFRSLQSQQISLGNCSLSVNGAAALANCSGTATWTPQVGGGTRTESRRWTFHLESAGDRWRISRATAH